MKIVTEFKTGVSSSKMGAILNQSPFKNVIDQFLLDTKQKEEKITASSQQKMDMGHVLEPVIKQLVEEYFGINLTVDKHRYEHDDPAYKGFTIEFDALDYPNETVYEFKNTEKDELEILKTYYPQVQFAMWMIGWNKARIGYLRSGWELGYVDVTRDDNFIEHMIEAGLYYLNCLDLNVKPEMERINEIVEQIDFYNNQPKTNLKGHENIELAEVHQDVVKKWIDVREKLSVLEMEEKMYKGMLEDIYGTYRNDKYVYSNVEYIREGGLDTYTLMKDHPEIDFSQYKKADTVYSKQQIKLKKLNKIKEELI